jgi:hypothetical protein
MVETIGRIRHDHLVEANWINMVTRDLKVRATRLEGAGRGRGRTIDMFRSSRRGMRFCIAQHWHRQIDLPDGDSQQGGRTGCGSAGTR